MRSSASTLAAVNPSTSFGVGQIQCGRAAAEPSRPFRCRPGTRCRSHRRSGRPSSSGPRALRPSAPVGAPRGRHARAQSEGRRWRRVPAIASSSAVRPVRETRRSAGSHGSDGAEPALAVGPSHAVKPPTLATRARRSRAASPLSMPPPVLRVAAALPRAELDARAYAQAAGRCHRPLGVVAVVWAPPRSGYRRSLACRAGSPERSRVTDGERAILALGAGLVTASLLISWLAANRE